MRFRGSIAGPRRSLSTLRQLELPPADARLASGRWPALPGGLGGPQGPYKRFPSFFLSRVTPGGYPPGVPTDPYVRISRIRLFRSGIRCRYPLLSREHELRIRCPGHVSLQRSPDGHPLSSPGSLRLRFPRLHGTMGCSDTQSSIPPCFVSFAWRYLALRLSSSLLAARRRQEAWCIWVRPHRATLHGMETPGSLKFLGNPPR